jgi:hypothetical protein
MSLTSHVVVSMHHPTIGPDITRAVQVMIIIQTLSQCLDARFRLPVY